MITASKQFNNEVLKAHNEYRQKHGVPPLKLCKKLNREAQQTLHSHGVEKHEEDGSGEGICQRRVFLRGGPILPSRECRQPGLL
eukprot:XP_022281308.1 Golgi-associated plant pathogenesis-related protein 1 isoform X2 [Canis lupus familiaris]